MTATKSVKRDKGLDEWVLIIYCDYGKEGTKREIRRSFSLESGERSWLKLKNMFGKNGRRCWQEDRKGNVVRDSRAE